MTTPHGSRWLILAIRVLLAGVFILYGVLKLLGLQLSTGDLSDVRFGDASPLIVTWHFFSLSPLYHHSIGIAQIITGLSAPRAAHGRDRSAVLLRDHSEYRPDQFRLRYRDGRQDHERDPARSRLRAPLAILGPVSAAAVAGGGREIGASIS